MSAYAYMWAKRQQVGDSSAKTLLKTYAHWAAEDYTCWVTNDELMLDTELNIQTIRKARAKLIEQGYLAETDRRLGDTRSIVVYQMLAPAGSTVVQAVDRGGETVSLSPPTAEEVAKRGEKQSPSKSRRTKGDEIQSPSKSEAHSNSTSSPSKSHAKGGEISSEGGGNLEGKKGVVVQEKEVGKQSTRRAPRVALHCELRATELPDWLPTDAWLDWCEHREAKDADKLAPWTNGAATASIKCLTRLRTAGQDAALVIEASVLRGWTGLFPVKVEPVVATVSGAVAPADWWKTSSGIAAFGKQLGKTQGVEETFMHFKVRVFKAAGPGEWMEELLSTVNRESPDRYAALYAYFNDIPSDKNGNTEAA